jgi:DNA-binding transcriptional MerR regulator
MEDDMSHSVGQVAGFAEITVRTLHHYDAIGLLSPSARSNAGHRRYAAADLDRLQQILLYRRLGFPLDQVAALLDDPEADPVEHLRRQHDLLTARIGELRTMADAVKHAMEARKMGIEFTPEERFEMFAGQDPEEVAAEAERRWGGTPEYAEHQRRTAAYTSDDWRRFKQESKEWGQRVIVLMDAGVPAGSEQAMELAEEHRQQICQWFYECGYEVHRGLAGMYLADDRFKQNYERIRTGMARYVHDAILANVSATPDAALRGTAVVTPWL